MQIIISPAKKMQTCEDDLGEVGRLSQPLFLAEAERLRQKLASFSLAELRALLGCNPQIAAENFERYQQMDLQKRLSPALLSYIGIQYQYMAPDVFTQSQYHYAACHLRILSGFYGILRPFDGVTPYRLEMQAPLKLGEEKNLYAFWGEKLYQALAAEAEDGVILNLASQEYAKAVIPYRRPGLFFAACIFGEKKEGRIRMKATEAKMARGEMVRWLAENQIKNLKEVKEFNGLGYRYSSADSRAEQLVFLKETPGKPREDF